MAKRVMTGADGKKVVVNESEGKKLDEDVLAREKFDPRMQQPTASSSAPPKGGLGAVAAAAAKKKKTQETQAQAVERY